MAAAVRVPDWVKRWGAIDAAAKSKVADMVADIKASGLVQDRSYYLTAYPSCLVRSPPRCR